MDLTNVSVKLLGTTAAADPALSRTGGKPTNKAKITENKTRFGIFDPSLALFGLEAVGNGADPNRRPTVYNNDPDTGTESLLHREGSWDCKAQAKQVILTP
jgi:hypothetical protein